MPKSVESVNSILTKTQLIISLAVVFFFNNKFTGSSLSVLIFLSCRYDKHSNVIYIIYNMALNN